MAEVGTLIVDLILDAKGLTRGTKEADKAIKGMEKQIDSATKAIDAQSRAAGSAEKQLGKLGKAADSLNTVLKAAVVVYAAKQLSSLAKSASDAITETIELTAKQAALADSMDATVTGLRAVNRAAADNFIDDLDGSLARLTRRLGAVENQGGPAANAVRALNLDARQLAQVDADEKLALIADAIEESGASSQQATRYLQDLGFQQQGVYNLFKDGGDNIRSYRGEVEALGLAVSRVEAEKLKEAQRALSSMGDTMDGLKNKAAIELAPAVTAIATMFEEWAQDATEGVGGIEGAVDSLMRAMSGLMDAADGVARTIEILVVTTSAASTALDKVTQKSKVAGTALSTLGGPAAMARNLWRGMRSEQEATAESSQSLADTMEQTVGRIQNILMRPMAADRLRQGIEDAEKAARTAALRNESRDTGAPAQGGPSGPSPAEQAAAQARLEELQRRLDAELQVLAEYGMSEQELLSQQYEEQVALLREANKSKLLGDADYFEARRKAKMAFDEQMLESQQEFFERELGLREEQIEDEAERTEALYEERLQKLEDALEDERITVEQHKEALLQIEQEYQDAMAAIQQREHDDRNKAMAGALSKATTLMNSHNKTAFKIGKVAAVAQAAINTAQGVTEAWKLGPIVGPPMAAMVAAAGAAQIAQIKRTKLGGGGTQASISNTAAINEASEPVRSAPAQDVFLRGLDPNQLYDGRQIMEALNQHIEDGGRIVGFSA